MSMSNLDPALDPALDQDVAPPIDLDRIERDLRDVESALARLADGTYFAPPEPASGVAS